MNLSRKSIAIVLVLSAIALGAGLCARNTCETKSTPPPSFHAVLRAEGRVSAYPGSDIVVGTDLGGTVSQVLVQEGDPVRKGQLLALIDARQEQAALKEAQSRVKELDADIRFLETEVKRNAALQREGIASRQSLDQIENQLSLARARSDAATATAERLSVTVSKLRILAPMEGVVVSRWANGGETVSPGARLIQIANLAKLRVEAEIDEYDACRVHLGTSVSIKAEGMEKTWKGTVEEIPHRVEGRRLKPQDPARPSDTRVLLVKVRLEEVTSLKLGQRVELEIQAGQS